MVAQIAWGSLVLTACTFAHLVLLAFWADLLRGLRNRFEKGPVWLMKTCIIAFTLVAIVLIHTIQVWVWAITLVAIGALQSYSDAIYFSLITYTTVGYGDLTLGPEFRLFGAMAAITELLGFGISTALLVSLVSKILPNHLNEEA